MSDPLNNMYLLLLLLIIQRSQSVARPDHVTTGCPRKVVIIRLANNILSNMYAPDPNSPPPQIRSEWQSQHGMYEKWWCDELDGRTSQPVCRADCRWRCLPWTCPSVCLHSHLTFAIFDKPRDVMLLMLINENTQTTIVKHIYHCWAP